MIDKAPRTAVRHHHALILFLLAAVLVCGLPGVARAQVVVSPAAFFGDCSTPIAVTTNTRVTGTLSAPLVCDVTVDPGVTLTFNTAVITMEQLSIGGPNGAVRIVNSRMDVVGLLQIDLPGVTSSAVVSNSLLQSTEIQVEAAAVSIAGSQLTGGSVSIDSVEARIIGSQLEGLADLVMVEAFNAATVRGSTLTSATRVSVGSSNGPIAVTNSRLRASNGQVVVFVIMQGSVTVASSVLTATGDAVTVGTAAGAARVTNSQLQSTTGGVFVAGEGATTVASSALSAATNMSVGVFGPTNVRTSRFTAGGDLLIDSLNDATSAVRNNFTGVTGLVTIRGTTGCRSVGNVPNIPCS